MTRSRRAREPARAVRARARAASCLACAATLVAACGGAADEDGAGGTPSAQVEGSGAADAAAAGGPHAPGAGSAPGWEVVAEGLEVPWDLAFAPDGRIFLSERPGRIRVIQDGALAPAHWAELDVAAVGEAGLTALALDPDFAGNGHVYVLGTFRSGGGLVNRVLRLTEEDGRGTRPTVLIDDLPADRFHAGGALDFGPDGLLYVTTGDALDPVSVQERSSLTGKLLRYRADGSPAPGNPLPGPVYAMGLRNTQGLDWHPSGEIFAAEHGPSGLSHEGGRTGHDELNHLRPGGNHGWPEVAGRGGGDRFIDPLAVWTPAIAPSGLAIYTGDDFPAWRGHAFLGALRGRHLRRVALVQADGGWDVDGQEALFEGELGRIRAVVMGPDGALYFTTSNRDGRGTPARSDDRVLRLVPR